MLSANVYINSDVCRYHLNCLNITPIDNIALATCAVFHIPFPYNSNFELDIDQALIHCDCIVILVSELHRTTVDFMRRYQSNKIKYFTCGYVKGIDSDLWMDWFVNTRSFYQQHTTLEQLTPYDTKEKMFDILLGASRPHRDFIYDHAHVSGIDKLSILTYYKFAHLELFNNDNFIWESDMVPVNPITHSIGKVKYHNTEISISTIVPISIYNQTAYSVVAETNFDNDYSFYTEKIVKPILAERLFIVFSGQYYLRNLRSLGFKTFDGIIDETYDTIEDPASRFGQAFKQMEYLITLSQADVLEQIREIAQHNKRLMFETDWQQQFHTNLNAVLFNHSKLSPA
jgi:hypothetical protein